MTDTMHRAPEEWRNLAPMGFSAYDVSSHGRVRTHKYLDAATGEPYIMAPSLNRYGYPVVQVCTDSGKPRVVAIHLLLCTAWHGPRPSAKHVVGHLYDVKTMNTPETLSWVTRSENMKQAYSNGCRVAGRTKGPLSAATVRAIRLRMNSGETCSKIAKDLGLGYAQVYLVATGVSYKWVHPTLVETERARRAEEAHRERVKAERAAAVSELEMRGLELGAAPEGARRCKAPHTPPAAAPKSKASNK